MTAYTITNSSGDVLLANAMPEAEYMYGCTPTAAGMILGYYDLYGYRGADLSNLIDGVVDLKSRGTDGNAYDMDAFDTVLGRAIASEDYVYRFYSRGDIDVITGKKAGTYWTTSVEEELEYSFVNGGEGPEMRTDIWNCIADYLGTGQIWRGNDNLATSISQSTLEDILNYEMNINYNINGISRIVDWRYTSMLYGLYLYVEDKGYSLDREITGTYAVDVAGGEFTFEDYKAEIDAGRPVLISIEGHSMTGYGYNPETNEIIFDDCYQADQRMAWGGTYHYSDMDLPLQSITVIGLMADSDVDIAVGAVTDEAGTYCFTADSVPFSSGDYCYVGSSVCLNFAVSNLGTGAAGAFDVSVYLDGALMKTVSVLSLDGNSSGEYRDIPLDGLAPGLHSVRIAADEENVIPEQSGANNVLEQKLMVLKEGANVVYGLKQVGSGEVSADDYVASGWQMHVLNGGTASGTFIRGIVTDVAPNGVISYLPGTAVVSQGGLLRDAAVYEYGRLQVGGTAANVSVYGNGSAGVASGGVLTGRIRMEKGAEVTFEDGAVLDFDLTQAEAGGEALVNALSLIAGTPVYTLTVSGTEAGGVYTLAEGADGFAGTITVRNTLGESLGTLTVGETVTVDKTDYLLALDGSALTLTVSVEKNVFSGDLTSETKDITSDWSAVDVNVNEGGTLNILDGGTAANTTVNGGGSLNVSSGGTAVEIVENGGYVNVLEGASVTFASNTFSGLVLSSAFATVHSGTTATDTTVNSGGGLRVFSGGVASNTTINTGGRVYVSSGGTAVEIVENGGYVNVADGADVTFAPNSFSGLVLDGKNLGPTVHSGTTATDTTVNFNGRMNVSSGGIANHTTINSGGSLLLSSGAVANSTMINSGAKLTLSCVIANHTTVNPGGHLVVGTYDTSATEIVENGGYVDVSLNNSNVSFASNSFSGLVLDSKNQSATIHSGTTATNTTVNHGGIMHVFSDGFADSTTINFGGDMQVSSGGIVSHVTVNPNASWTVRSGVVVSDIMLYDGRIVIDSGGTATGIQLDLGETNSDSYVYSSRIHLQVRGTVTDVTVNSGTRMEQKGTANNVTVNSGGIVSMGVGSANGLTVNPGGTAFVRVGTATNIIENGGYVFCRGDNASEGFKTDYRFVSFVPNSFSGVVLSGTIATVHSGTTANSVTVNLGGGLHVYFGGIANDTEVNYGNTSGGGLYIVGGTANNTTVNESGYLGIFSGGVANNTILQADRYRASFEISDGTANNTVVNSRGSVWVNSNAVANNTTVNSGGWMWVSRGLANDTIINSGGIVSMGVGIANDITVNSGGNMHVWSGKMTGKMTFEEGAFVSVEEDTILDFDISELAPEAGARVNSLAIIQGTPVYTLTVSDTQSGGIYTLAEGAAGFDSTITVQNTAGESLGTLTVGETVTVGNNSYTLNLAKGVLSVTAVAPDLTPTDPAGTAEGISWKPSGADSYIVEYSTDNFEHVVTVVTTGNAIDSPELPAGTYQWRVKADANSDWAVGEAIVSEADSGTPKVVQAVGDGNDDLFFATANGTWENIYYAQHVGSVNDWTGTNELISAAGKGRIQNLFFGSADPNVLCLTDGENGDAVFVDDVYTELPEEIEENTARLYRIHEIRAGAGDDIVDMTSQRFEYVGEGLTIRGGDGNDTIWANKGGNRLFGDAGNDRIVGASGNDVIAGGIGNDRMHGGGGDDVFTFCDNWGTDTVEQLAGGSVTLWFASGDESNWNAETLTYTDGDNSVKVSGVTADKVTLKFGSGDAPEDAAQFATLSGMGAFLNATSERIFEESGKGMLSGG